MLLSDGLRDIQARTVDVDEIMVAKIVNIVLYTTSDINRTGHLQETG